MQPLVRPGCLVELLPLPLARPQHGAGGGDHGRLSLLHPGQSLVAELSLGLGGDTLEGGTEVQRVRQRHHSTIQCRGRVQ